MKKKLLAIFLIVCILAITISTASLAYFTDTKTVDNVFSVGEVKITLDEAKVVLDAQNHATVHDTDRVTSGQEPQKYGNLYPGFSIKKDPTITNTGSESAYVGAKIVITTTSGITDTSAFVGLLTGGLLPRSDDAIVDERLVGNAYEISIIYKKALAGATESAKDSVLLFDTLSIPSNYENAQMAQFKYMKITVTAYAVQSVGMTDALSALPAAFAVFDHIPTPTPTPSN